MNDYTDLPNSASVTSTESSSASYRQIIRSHILLQRQLNSLAATSASYLPAKYRPLNLWRFTLMVIFVGNMAAIPLAFMYAEVPDRWRTIFTSGALGYWMTSASNTLRVTHLRVMGLIYFFIVGWTLSGNGSYLFTTAICAGYAYISFLELFHDNA